MDHHKPDALRRLPSNAPPVVAPSPAEDIPVPALGPLRLETAVTPGDWDSHYIQSYEAFRDFECDPGGKP